MRGSEDKMHLWLSWLHTNQSMTQSLKSQWWLVVDALVLTHLSRGLPWEARVIVIAGHTHKQRYKSCEIPGFIYVLFFLSQFTVCSSLILHSRWWACSQHLCNLSKSRKQLWFIFIPSSLSFLWRGSQRSPLVFNHPFSEARQSSF